jgi:hypothetical protein
LWVTSPGCFLHDAPAKGPSDALEDGRYLARFEAAREFFEMLAREQFDPARPTAKIMIAREHLLGKVIEGRKL